MGPRPDGQNIYEQEAARFDLPGSSDDVVRRGGVSMHTKDAPNKPERSHDLCRKGPSSSYLHLLALEVLKTSPGTTQPILSLNK